MAGATVTVTPAPAFSFDLESIESLYSGPLPHDFTTTTDRHGRFQMGCYAGSWVVSAYRTAGGPIVADADATVVAGGYSEVSLTVLPLPPAFAIKAAVPVAAVGNITFAWIGAGELLRLTVQGTASTSGWTYPQLRARPSTDPNNPQFDLVAVPPPGAPAGSPTPVTAIVDVPVNPTTNNQVVGFAHLL